MAQEIYGDRNSVRCKEDWRPRTSEENIEHVGQAFQRSMKSIRSAARQLDLPRATVHKVLHKNLTLFAYKVQMFTDTSAKRQAKTERICSEHAPTNF